MIKQLIFALHERVINPCILLDDYSLSSSDESGGDWIKKKIIPDKNEKKVPDKPLEISDDDHGFEIDPSTYGQSLPREYSDWICWTETTTQIENDPRDLNWNKKNMKK